MLLLIFFSDIKRLLFFSRVCIPKALPNEPVDLHSHSQCSSNTRIQCDSHNANHLSEVNPPSTSTNNNLNAENPACLACNMGQGDPYYQELMQGYDPELREEDNPHYFSINRLLFEAHASRTGRHRTDFSNTWLVFTGLQFWCMATDLLVVLMCDVESEWLLIDKWWERMLLVSVSYKICYLFVYQTVHYH